LVVTDLGGFVPCCGLCLGLHQDSQQSFDPFSTDNITNCTVNITYGINQVDQ